MRKGITLYYLALLVFVAGLPPSWSPQPVSAQGSLLEKITWSYRGVWNNQPEKEWLAKSTMTFSQTVGENEAEFQNVETYVLDPYGWYEGTGGKREFINRFNVNTRRKTLPVSWTWTEYLPSDLDLREGATVTIGGTDYQVVQKSTWIMGSGRLEEGKREAWVLENKQNIIAFSDENFDTVYPARQFTISYDVTTGVMVTLYTNFEQRNKWGVKVADGTFRYEILYPWSPDLVINPAVLLITSVEAGAVDCSAEGEIQKGVTVRWNAPTHSDVDHYEIEVCKEGDSDTCQTDSPSATVWSSENLGAGTYEIEVIAYDDAENVLDQDATTFTIEKAADGDLDGIDDVCDNCPNDDNGNQLNSDNDSLGDACDNCPNDDNQNQLNSDNDTHGDACDNCPNHDNENQLNSDNDSHGDACDNCPNDDNQNQLNVDLDSYGDACDNCPNHHNDNQLNSDNDSHGDACDNCPNDDNQNQLNSDNDSHGDACDLCERCGDWTIVHGCPFSGYYGYAFENKHNKCVGMSWTAAMYQSGDVTIPTGLPGRGSNDVWEATEPMNNYVAVTPLNENGLTATQKDVWDLIKDRHDSGKRVLLELRLNSTVSPFFVDELHKIMRAIDDGKVCLVGFGYSDPSNLDDQHCVVAYDYTWNPSSGEMKLVVYDPNKKYQKAPHLACNAIVINIQVSGYYTQARFTYDGYDTLQYASADKNESATERAAGLPGAAGGFLASLNPMSGAELHAYDGQGRHTGPDGNGGVEKGIPGSEYELDEATGGQVVIIPSEGEENFTLRIQGTSPGQFNLAVKEIDGPFERTYIYRHNPLTASTVAELELGPENNSILRVDGEGDGTFEMQKTPDGGFVDSDGDGLSDHWESLYGTQLNIPDASDDPDDDNLTNYEEHKLRTHPLKDDTDSDGVRDGWDICHGFDDNTDSDGDGIPDGCDETPGYTRPAPWVPLLLLDD